MTGRTIHRLALFALLLAALGAQAQLPPGKWWRRPEVVQRLQLSEDQQTRLDAVHRTSLADLIDLRANVEKQSLALRVELDQPQLNRTNIQRAASRLSEARGRLFERELMMLVDMRAVLSDMQWNRMRAELNAREEQGRPMGPRNGRRQQ